VIVSVPDELQDVTVTVTYSYKEEGSYRATTHTIADEVAVVDGKVALDEAINQAAYGDYTITISSSNYAPTSITLEAPMTESQRAQLEELVAEGNALLAIVDHSLLAEHVEEAEELLAETAPTSGDATELLDEMPTYIEEAKALVATALSGLVSDANVLTESDYTEATWTALQTALAAANAALAEEDIPDNIADIYTDLQEAIDALADVTLVSDQLDEIAELVQSDYTEESWAALEEAVAKAEEALQTAETQEDIALILADLADAVAALETVDSEGDTLVVRRGNTYYFQDSLSDVSAYMTAAYGKATDEVLVGDWNGDGVDTLCVRRGNTYYFSNTMKSGKADKVLSRRTWVIRRHIR